MIIDKAAARGMDKDKLSEMASDYATEFSRLLGHKEKIIIKPEQVIFDKKEAKSFFLKKFYSKSFSKEFRKLAKLRRKELKNDINEESAFVFDNVAYIPLSYLDADERSLLRKLGINRRLLPLLEEFYDMFFREKKYFSLNGFGSEIAHLVGDALYPKETSKHLGESLDMASQILENSKDVRFLYEISDKKSDLEALMKEELDEYISHHRRELDICESWLLDGAETARKKIMDEMPAGKLLANTMLSVIYSNFIFSKHYEGRKLFIELFDSVGGDLRQTYKRLGEILSNGNVRDMYAALKELGYSDEKLSKYEGIFGKNILEKLRYVDKHKERIGPA